MVVSRVRILTVVTWHQCIVAIINVYDPNLSTMRALFWRQLVDGLPFVDVCILTRDFNMTLHLEDNVVDQIGVKDAR